jgi:hypothetical protein
LTGFYHHYFAVLKHLKAFEQKKEFKKYENSINVYNELGKKTKEIYYQKWIDLENERMGFSPHEKLNFVWKLDHTNELNLKELNVDEFRKAHALSCFGEAEFNMIAKISSSSKKLSLGKSKCFYCEKEKFITVMMKSRVVPKKWMNKNNSARPVMACFSCHDSRTNLWSFAENFALAKKKINSCKKMDKRFLKSLISLKTSYPLIKSSFEEWIKKDSSFLIIDFIIKEDVSSYLYGKILNGIGKNDSAQSIL